MPIKKQVKRKRLDPHVVSMQPFELSYICKKFGVSKDKVLDAKKAVGRSRKKIYNYLRNLKK